MFTTWTFVADRSQWHVMQVFRATEEKSSQLKEVEQAGRVGLLQAQLAKSAKTVEVSTSTDVLQHGSHVQNLPGGVQDWQWRGLHNETRLVLYMSDAAACVLVAGSA